MSEHVKKEDDLVGRFGKLAPALMALALVLGVIATWGNMPSRVSVLEKKADVQEAHYQEQRTDFAVMQNDISYIKEKVKKF